MSPIPFVAIALLAQTFPSATEKTGSWTFGTTKSSASHHTGYVPFEVSFPCTFDFVGPKNGCYVRRELEFDTILGGVYPNRGDQPSTDSINPIKTAQIHLSGVRLSFLAAGGGISYSSFIPLSEVYVDSQIASLSSDKAVWFVHTNLRDYPSTMVDNFQVWVSGEIVWSDGEASEVTSVSLSCQDEAETCSDTRSYSLPYDLSGVALGFVQVADPIEGKETDRLEVATTITPSSSTAGDVTTTCTLSGAHQIQCATRAIIVSGLSTEMEPFESQPFTHTGLQPGNNQFWTNGQVDASPTSYELHREMACGLRSFSLFSRNVAGYWGGMQFGATSTDCGFNGVTRPATTAGTWDFGGLMNHGFLIDDGTGTPDDYTSSFVLDGNKLLWP